ncbi:MAG: hypothetical protein ACRDRA_10065 [Pseudonocardiaceae bacterium]
MTRTNDDLATELPEPPKPPAMPLPEARRLRRALESLDVATHSGGNVSARLRPAQRRGRPARRRCPASAALEQPMISAGSP